MQLFTLSLNGVSFKPNHNLHSFLVSQGTLRGFAKKEKFKKSEITMEVGGWGGSRFHSEFFFWWKIVPNGPKPVSTDILE